MPEGFDRISFSETNNPTIFGVLSKVKPGLKPFAVTALVAEVQEIEALLSLDKEKATNTVVFLFNLLQDLK